MEAGQCEAGRRVSKRAVAPICRGVALIAGLRESGRYVVGIRGALEVFEVALSAGAARQAVVVVDMALGAGE